MTPSVAGTVLGSCHLGPSLATTSLATALAVASGADRRTTLRTAAAVGAGQLVVGWTNDALDADDDARTGRTDKPLAGRVGPWRRGAHDAGVTAVAVAGTTALATSAAASAALGPAAGALQLGAVLGGGLAYDLGAKRTAWSWAPYAVAFGSLPVVVVQAATGAAPPAHLPLAAGLLGVGAHLLDALPDLDLDAQVGVHGLPHRLGAGRSRAAAAACLLAGTAAATAPGVRTRPAAVAAVAAASTALVGVVLRGRGRAPFAAAVGAAALCAGQLLVSARSVRPAGEGTRA